MTQAFNLSQLANNLNSSGRLDATDGLVNAVPVANGGTGASTSSAARTNLGLGSIATQNASSVSITGGSITGITDLAIADGGTGASTAANARTNLGLGSLSTVTPSGSGSSSNFLRGDNSWQVPPTLAFPDYSSPVSLSVNVVSQASSNGFITVAAWGQYRNSMAIYVGDTNSVPYLIALMGEDINLNTWGWSYSFPIKSGSWFKIQNGTAIIGPADQGFENVTAYFWPVS